MQDPPPVSTLLTELSQFATAVQQRLLDDASDIDWLWSPGAEQWSLTDVMCHLRDVELEVHQARFQALIEMDNTFLPGATADDWVVERHYRQQDGPQAAAAFVAARRQTAVLLQGVGEEMWQRYARHAFFGRTSMHELLNLVVQHDQAHWQQIKTLVNDAHSRGMT